LSNEILIDVSENETRLVIVEDGRAVEYIVEACNGGRLIGNVYRGKVENVLPGMQAAFVDIGFGKNAFLNDFTSNESIKAGQEIAVQVTREAVGEKGPSVTTKISLPGRHLVLLRGSEEVGVSKKITDDAQRERLREIASRHRPLGFGLLCRTAAQDIDELTLLDEISSLKALSDSIDSKMRAAKVAAPDASCLYSEPDLLERAVRDLLNESLDKLVINDSDSYLRALDLVEAVALEFKSKIQLYSKEYEIFDFYGVGGELASRGSRKVCLKSGGNLVFDKTEAMMVIDVNSGKFTGASDLVYKTNMEAAMEIPRQLRLRNIGGIIIIDFIDMSLMVHQAEILGTLREGVERDRSKVTVVGITELGLIEITRRKL